jgi:hypothetical protein
MSNPFSTRFVRPGSVPFIFPQGVSAETLVDRLRQYAWRGAIVGPHGSGKSTLLEALVPAIEQAGRQARRVSLHDGERRLPAEFVWPKSSEPAGVVIVDGYEQLSWLARRKLNTALRRSGWGLLATVHSLPVRSGLPELYRVEPTFEVFQLVVNHLLAAQRSSIRPEDISAAFHAHPHNLREALFALYDLIEHRKASPA